MTPQQLNPSGEALKPLREVSFDPELTPGARNAVRVCLNVQPKEKVTLITDVVTHEIAASLLHELDEAGATCTPFVLEAIAARPLEIMPLEVLRALENSDVSIFAVKVQQNELRSRMQMTDVVNRKRIRHAHMVNIDRRIMLEGMRADYRKVDEISRKVVDIVSKAHMIEARTPAGTDMRAEMNPAYRWLKTSGIISREKWGNLPGGEVFTTPGEVNGIFVVDGVVGDYLCACFGDLKEYPLTVQMRQNRITEVSSANKELQESFWRYTHTDENSDRVGEFAIGTNIELKNVIGEILQDEKFPGVHIAFGNPYGEHTGAQWFSSTHIDIVGREFDIVVDGRQIMRRGQFTIS